MYRANQLPKRTLWSMGAIFCIVLFDTFASHIKQHYAV